MKPVEQLPDGEYWAEITVSIPTAIGSQPKKQNYRIQILKKGEKIEIVSIFITSNFHDELCLAVSW